MEILFGRRAIDKHGSGSSTILCLTQLLPDRPVTQFVIEPFVYAFRGISDKTSSGLETIVDDDEIGASPRPRRWMPSPREAASRPSKRSKS
jgi:hypothetical protein